MDSLTSLTIRLRQQPGQRGYAQSITLGLLRECLRWHPNLVTFRLGFHRNDTYPVSLHSEYMPPSVWRKKLQIRGPADENTTMPKLESLLLVGISMIPAEFLAFLSPLTSSLKVLELELVGLIGIGSWVSTLPQLREWTQASALERLSIRGSLLERKGINDVTYPLRGSRIKDGETAGLDRRVIEYLMHAGEFPLASACDERDSRPYESLGKRKRLR
ncbi:hypothetical protein BU16DRAFT_530762 [Lophium mytilinum]|uniref:Uncharacterized protein n=1 Tax=Lophium mytilinum TaxID=390894 RepID=A0A6A6QDT4_9PEZI|nr:hypothetical protein BU16DRAFT_530762 [Lophium mytilinum]